MKQRSSIDCQLQNDLLLLILEAVSPWLIENENVYGRTITNQENWSIADITIKDDLARICIMHKVQRGQYTALVCMVDSPEIIAVSYTDGNLGMLNPYLDCGHKLEADLDGPGCWNVLSITFAAEPGAQAIRYLRGGEVEEVYLNEFGAFSIIDWAGNQPVEEFLGVKISGKWQRPAVAAIPYTIDYIASYWCRCVVREDNFSSREACWIRAAFIELCGTDRAILQHKIMNTLAEEPNDFYFQAFKKERRKFLDSEQASLGNFALPA